MPDEPLRGGVPSGHRRTRPRRGSPMSARRTSPRLVGAVGGRPGRRPVSADRRRPAAPATAAPPDARRPGGHRGELQPVPRRRHRQPGDRVDARSSSSPTRRPCGRTSRRPTSRRAPRRSPTCWQRSTRTSSGCRRSPNWEATSLTGNPVPSYDFLEILLDALAERGTPYRAIATNTNFVSPQVPIQPARRRAEVHRPRRRPRPCRVGRRRGARDERPAAHLPGRRSR